MKSSYCYFPTRRHGQSSALDLLQGVVLRVVALLPMGLIHMAISAPTDLTSFVLEQVLDFGALRLRFHLKLVVHHDGRHDAYRNVHTGAPFVVFVGKITIAFFDVFTFDFFGGTK